MKEENKPMKASEVMQLFKMSRYTLNRLIAEKKLTPKILTGGRTQYFNSKEVNALLK